MLLYAIFLIFTISFIKAEECTNGNKIFKLGISEKGKQDVVNGHNKFRLQIARGKVQNQPIGIDLKKLQYDNTLGQKARVVSMSCKLNHIPAKDKRWWWVGQNIYIEWNSAQKFEQNWDTAVASWFGEVNDFIYPNNKKPGSMTGHYTQLVWATTTHVGCDFVMFYDDKKKPKTPYGRMYTCNYGPGGNVNNAAPYKTGKTTKCKDLC